MDVIPKGFYVKLSQSNVKVDILGFRKLRLDKTRVERNLSLIGLSIFAILAGSLISAPLASAITFSFVETFNSFPNNGSFYNYPSALAIDSSGIIYVADTNNHRVLKLK